jgi:hypothetical protein
MCMQPRLSRRGGHTLTQFGNMFLSAFFLLSTSSGFPTSTTGVPGSKNAYNHAGSDTNALRTANTNSSLLPSISERRMAGVAATVACCVATRKSAPAGYRARVGPVGGESRGFFRALPSVSEVASEASSDSGGGGDGFGRSLFWRARRSFSSWARSERRESGPATAATATSGVLDFTGDFTSLSAPDFLVGGPRPRPRRY